MNENYWVRRTLSRRRLLGSAITVSAGIGAIGTVGCGDDDGGRARTPTATETTPASPATAAATATPGVTRGGTAHLPIYGTGSANPPTIYPFENVSYLAQIPAGLYYSRLLRGQSGPGIDGNDQTKLEGDIAQKWEQPDTTTNVFTLKPNAKWHDKAPMNGRAVTAGDWLKTYDAFLAISPNKGSWQQVVEKVEAPDDRTLKITLKAPFSPFLSTHAASSQGVWFIPAETISNDQAKKSPVGSGPFTFDSFESGVAITAQKNPAYYDAPLPNFAKIEMLALGDPQRLAVALQSGDIDLVSGPGSSIWKSFRSKLDPKGQDTFTQSTSPISFYFNFDNKPWNDVRVRQALSMAIDRDGALKVLDATGKGNYNSFVPAGHAPYYLSPRDSNKDYGTAGKYWQRNVADARALLKAATGADTLNFRLYANIDRYGADYQQAWEVYAATIKDAGFNAELTYIEYGQYIQSIIFGKIPEGGCAVGPIIGSADDPDSVFMQCYWSKSSRHNWAGTPIPEQADLDSMFEKQRTILNVADRVKYVQDIQKKMSESFLVVPTVSVANWAFAQPWLQNFAFKAGYGLIPDSLMKANFTPDRVKKG